MHPVFRAEQTKVTIQDVIAAERSRSPDVDHSQRKFNTGIVVLVAHGQSPSHELIERANGIRQQWIEYWQTTTGRRASMTATHADRPPLGGEPILNNVDCRIALQCSRLKAVKSTDSTSGALRACNSRMDAHCWKCNVRSEWFTIRTANIVYALQNRTHSNRNIVAEVDGRGSTVYLMVNSMFSRKMVQAYHKHEQKSLKIPNHSTLTSTYWGETFRFWTARQARSHMRNQIWAVRGVPVIYFQPHNRFRLWTLRENTLFSVSNGAGSLPENF